MRELDDITSRLKLKLQAPTDLSQHAPPPHSQHASSLSQHALPVLSQHAVQTGLSESTSAVSSAIVTGGHSDGTAVIDGAMATPPVDKGPSNLSAYGETLSRARALVANIEHQMAPAENAVLLAAVNLHNEDDDDGDDDDDDVIDNADDTYAPYWGTSANICDSDNDVGDSFNPIGCDGDQRLFKEAGDFDESEFVMNEREAEGDQLGTEEEDYEGGGEIIEPRTLNSISSIDFANAMPESLASPQPSDHGGFSTGFSNGFISRQNTGVDEVEIVTTSVDNELDIEELCVANDDNAAEDRTSIDSLTKMADDNEEKECLEKNGHLLLDSSAHSEPLELFNEEEGKSRGVTPPAVSRCKVRNSHRKFRRSYAQRQQIELASSSDGEEETSFVKCVKKSTVTSENSMNGSAPSDPKSVASPEDVCGVGDVAGRAGDDNMTQDDDTSKAAGDSSYPCEFDVLRVACQHNQSRVNNFNQRSLCNHFSGAAI